MTEETSASTPTSLAEPDYTPVRDPDRVPTVFVNEIIGTGTLNGVVNLTFATLRFTPTIDLSEVLPDRVVSSRLRMDLYTAQQLHEQLGRVIAGNTKPAAANAN